MSQTFLEDIPEFLEIQRNSFLRILDTGLIQAFEKINPILPTFQCKYGLLFYPKDYVLVLPENTITEAFLQGKTYGCKIYVPAVIYEGEKSTSVSKSKFLTRVLGQRPKAKGFVKKNIWDSLSGLKPKGIKGPKELYSNRVNSKLLTQGSTAPSMFPNPSFLEQKKLTPKKLANSLEILRVITKCSVLYAYYIH